MSEILEICIIFRNKVPSMAIDFLCESEALEVKIWVYIEVFWSIKIDQTIKMPIYASTQKFTLHHRVGQSPHWILFKERMYV